MASAVERPPKNGALRPGVVEERQALLKRVLWSRQIEKSARIRELLSYVCERALQDPAAEIHEQEIGARVFGRAADYDTAADNVVRVTASQARRKLEQYFASDGLSEPVILEIPRGRYAPVFRDRDAAPVIAEPEKIPDAAPAGRRILVPLLGLCVVVLAVSTIWLGVRLRHSWTAGTELDTHPALASLWPQLFPRPGSDRTDVVVTDSSLSLFQELLDRPLTLQQYLNPDTWESAGGFSANPQLQTFARRAAQRRFTSLASVTAIFRIGQIAGSDQSRLSIFSARDFNVRQMKTDNLILLGSTRANPWMELIQDRLNFRFGFDQTSHFSFFENRRPGPGELKIYRTDSGVSYCQVAFLPNLAANTNILAVAGTEVEGTEGGSEFVTSEVSVSRLRHALGADKQTRMPYFEALLKSSRVGGSAPGFSLVAVRHLSQ